MKVKLTVLLAFLPSVVYASESFNGLRVGVGYSSTSILDDSEFYDYGDGLKLELGYDFNRIVGINLSYQESDYSETTYFETLKVDGTTVKVDADVGFAFDFQGWSLKPMVPLVLHLGKRMSSSVISLIPQVKQLCY